MPTHRAVLSIGSNIGDKLAHLRRGLSLLELSGAARIVARSRFFRTRPVDFVDQDWFVNAAVVVQTALPPRALLAALKAIDAGRRGHKCSLRPGPDTDTVAR
ncbi:MAG: 2-amino-4-hydroxy-6-hydroxymethyldihydropteridine diphosphokinase [Desulfobacterales bacterium]|nr:2-amino-4-hydroxy-6-hydroxymethyldihydropteridine diphosphokinase [Desulfobacterales bacterium]